MNLIHLDFDNKESIFKTLQFFLNKEELPFKEFDFERPWGGFFTFSESHLSRFLELFFNDVNINLNQNTGLTFSPKILCVAPNQRLSWQYHNRRSEIWRCIEGEVGVTASDNDIENICFKLTPNDWIKLELFERHRLVGLSNWGILAEIWIHTDSSHPSDEDDIIRLQDDYFRK